MLYFQIAKRNVHEEEVTMVSWLDGKQMIWHALAPLYIRVVPERPGISAATREEALDHLTAALTQHLASQSPLLPAISSSEPVNDSS